MNLRTILAFQFGNRGAIEKAANSSAAMWTGLILTLTVSIARNYDQTWILDSPMWLFGNVLFSLISSSLIFALIYGIFITKRFPHNNKTPNFAQQYRSFLGLFWMTAPIAWLYAIPVERWFDSYLAAQCNLALLGIVSLWRVLLLARVLSVVTRTRYARTLLWTLLVASTEIVAVMFIGLVTNTNRHIMEGMSGMRNSPEESMIMNALASVFMVSLGVWLATALVLAAWRNRSDIASFPTVSPSRVHWVPLIFVAVCWIATAIEPQRRLEHNSNYDHLLRSGKYDEAIAFIRSHQRDDFSHYKRLAPDPYAWEVWEHLGPILDRIEADDPLWLRKHYYEHMGAALSHSVRHFFSFKDRGSLYTSLLKTTSRLPEGEEFVKQHHDELITIQRATKDFYDSESDHVEELQRLLNDLLGPLPEEN